MEARGECKEKRGYRESDMGWKQTGKFRENGKGRYVCVSWGLKSILGGSVCVCVYVRERKMQEAEMRGHKQTWEHGKEEVWGGRVKVDS